MQRNFSQDIEIRQGNDGRWFVPTLNLNSGERTGIATVGVAPIPYQATVVFKPNVGAMDVTNTGSTTIPESYVYFGGLNGEVATLPALGPGESRTVDETMITQQLPFLPGLSQDETERLQALLYDENQFVLNTNAMSPSLMIIDRSAIIQPTINGELNTPKTFAVYVLYAEVR
jgi:hypothetical protein